MADLVPAKDAALRQHAGVVDGVVRAVGSVLVDVVRDEQVHALARLYRLTKAVEKGGERVAVEPVVGVDDLVVDAVGALEALEDRHAMAAVLLVDGLDDARVALLPGVGLGGSVILGGAVVHDHDLDVVGICRALQDRLDAVVHVVG